jgi:hypothetical protein
MFDAYLLYIYARESGGKMQQKLQKAYGSPFPLISVFNPKT